jgi:hypothetical protein
MSNDTPKVLPIMTGEMVFDKLTRCLTIVLEEPDGNGMLGTLGDHRHIDDVERLVPQIGDRVMVPADVVGCRGGVLTLSNNWTVYINRAVVQKTNLRSSDLVFRSSDESEDSAQLRAIEKQLAELQRAVAELKEGRK